MIQGHLGARGNCLVPDYDDMRAQFCVCKIGVDSRNLI